MADNQESKRKKKRKSYFKDGVVMKVSEIERECERLKRRPRAALYPLLPITEPLKLKRKSIHVQKGAKRHRKHCRKRLPFSKGLEKKTLPPSCRLSSRTRLVSSETSGSLRTALQHYNQHKGPLPVPHWASAEQFHDGALEPPPPLQTALLGLVEPPRHHHYHTRKHRHRICHHDPLLVGHRTSATASLKDLRAFAGACPSRHRRRCPDPEAGLGDKDSTSSNARSRRIVSFIVASVASFILMMCVALVAVTLRLTPAIDELVRKGNEEIYRSMSAGASTSSPTTEDAVVVNNTTPPSSTPG